MELSEVYQQNSAPDLAKELGYDGIRVLLNIMSNAYIELLNSSFVQMTTPEDDITEEWFVKIMGCMAELNLPVVPIHQKQDRTMEKESGKPPTIDFCFRHKIVPESYFGAECKLLDEGETKYFLEYVNENGLGRFLDGRYSSCSSAGSMIGYVRTGDPKQVAIKVSERLAKLPNAPKMTKDDPLDSFRHIYKSNHKRKAGLSKIHMYHLFFAFNC